MFTPQVIIATILVFFVIVGFHEWGHFFFAKRAGILVREFAIGFGPRLFTFKRGETRYTFRLLPVGGFVRMAGEDPENIQINPGQTIALQVESGKVTKLYVDLLDQRSNAAVGVMERMDLEKELYIDLEQSGDVTRFPVDPKAHIVRKGEEFQIAPWDRQFGGKTVAQRGMSIFAGPLMNFILAFLLFFVFMYLSGIPIKSPSTVTIGHIVPDSPAEQAELRTGDIIDSVNGKPIGGDRESLIKLINASAGKSMEFIVERGGTKLKLTVTPAEQDGVGKVGIELPVPTRTPSAIEALSGAGDRMVSVSQMIFTGLKSLVTLQFAWDDLGGPLRIAEVTGEAASMGTPTLVYWTAILSLYLGIFNLLPFPALDGSRLVFLAIESVRGKPVNPNRESLVHFIGFAMLMLLMIAVTYNDILRIFKG